MCSHSCTVHPVWLKGPQIKAESLYFELLFLISFKPLYTVALLLTLPVSECLRILLSRCGNATLRLSSVVEYSM